MERSGFTPGALRLVNEVFNMANRKPRLDVADAIVAANKLVRASVNPKEPREEE